MYKYLIAIAVVLPLVGVAMMENGAFGPSIGLHGYPNGAALAYALYAFVLMLSCLLFAGVSVSTRQEVPCLVVSDQGRFRSYLIVLAAVNILILLLMLFWIGAIDVWSGRVAKGEFRASLGRHGAIAYLLTKIFVPALLAYAACLYTTVSQRGLDRVLFWSAATAAFLIGASWGFKSTAILMLLPALLILYWRITLFRFALLGLIVMLVLVAFYFVFDIQLSQGAVVLDLLWTRLTVIQGDVPWLIWNQHVNGVEFPPYARTLLPVVGDRLFSLITGLDKADYYVWVQYHYDLLLTYLAGIPLDLIKGGYSITGTPFAESVVALGALGPIVFGLLAGAIIGMLYRFLNHAIRHGQFVKAALLSTYFCFYVLSWLSGGAIIQLMHISVLVGLAVVYFTIVVASRLRLGRVGMPGRVTMAPHIEQ